MKLLLAEDEPIQLHGLAQYLTECGHSVTLANTATEAVQRLYSGEHYDAVILDVCLPEGTGKTVLSLLRSLPQYEKIPVIVTSGLRLDKLDFLAAQPHVTVLQKPFDLSAISSILSGGCS